MRARDWIWWDLERLQREESRRRERRARTFLALCGVMAADGGG